MADVQGLLADPRFQQLDPAQQKEALGRIDDRFTNLSDADFNEVKTKLAPALTTTQKVRNFMLHGSTGPAEPGTREYAAEHGETFEFPRWLNISAGVLGLGEGAIAAYKAGPALLAAARAIKAGVTPKWASKLGNLVDSVAEEMKAARDPNYAELVKIKNSGAPTRSVPSKLSVPKASPPEPDFSRSVPSQHSIPKAAPPEPVPAPEPVLTRSVPSKLNVPKGAPPEPDLSRSVPSKLNVPKVTEPTPAPDYSRSVPSKLNVPKASEPVSAPDTSRSVPSQHKVPQVSKTPASAKPDLSNETLAEQVEQAAPASAPVPAPKANPYMTAQNAFNQGVRAPVVESLPKAEMDSFLTKIGIDSTDELLVERFIRHLRQLGKTKHK